MKLAALQDLFQSAVLGGDRSSLLEEIPDSPKETRQTLFQVYADAYGLRLIEVLATDFPHLKSLMGPRGFDMMARSYIAAHPSHQRNARWFGTEMATFLRSHEVYRRRPVLAELAAIETALNDAFDAPDHGAALPEILMQVAPQNWERLQFRFHPGVRMLALQTNAVRIWMTLKDDTKPPRARRLRQTENVLVWRQESTSKLRILPPEEAMAWHEASRGVQFGRLCELIAHFDDPSSAAIRASSYLKGWIETGTLAAVTVPD